MVPSAQGGAWPSPTFGESAFGRVAQMLAVVVSEVFPLAWPSTHYSPSSRPELPHGTKAIFSEALVSKA